MSSFVLDKARVSQIATAMHGICAGLSSDLDSQNEAKDAVTKAGEVANGTRERIMLAVSEASVQGSWFSEEVKAAVPMAVAKVNSLDSAKAIATFIGECKRAAHPLVRDHVSALLSIRNQAWDEEATLSKDFPKPVQKAFKRRYHAFIAAMTAVEDGVVISTAEDLTNYARGRDPDHNVDSVFKRLTKIREDLAAFAVDFPVEDIQMVVETLAKVSKPDLVLARSNKLTVDNQVINAVVPAIVPAMTVAAPAVSKLAAAFAPTVPATTVVDALSPEEDAQARIDALMNDNLDILAVA